MDCGICRRPQSDDLGFYCPSCARSTLYTSRLEAARVLIAKEQVATTIEAIVSPNSKEPTPSKATHSIESLSQIWSIKVEQIQRQRAEEKTEHVLYHTEKLREEIAQIREDMARRRSDCQARKAAMESISTLVSPRRARFINAVSERTRRGSHSSDAVHNKTAQNRAFLCREAALLLRLRQQKRKKAGVAKNLYTIAGLPVTNLRDINNVRCADLTASFASVAHLVVLVAFYLSIRLPAEITLPGRDYPQPTISTPATSYTGRKVPFPGSTPNVSGHNSPSASRQGDGPTLPRPRPLFLNSDDKDERIAQLARRDAGSFNLFVEGISLLAWDIAWLCRSQGRTSGTETWEDICNVGENLFQLLLGPQNSLDPTNIASKDDSKLKSKTSKEVSKVTETVTKQVSPIKLGERSHASAYIFLGDGQFLLRGWKVSKYTMIADGLKKVLVSEMSNAEWEILEEQEWDDRGEPFEEAVMIKTRPMNDHEYDDSRSILTARVSPDNPRSPDKLSEPILESGRNNPNSWTKLKRRD